MATFQLFHEFKKFLGDGTIDLDSHTFKAVLSNTDLDVAVADLYGDVTEIANGNGYTTGGITMTSVTWTETGSGTGVWRWGFADFTWTASAGSIGPFQYVYFYDDTPTSPADPLVGKLDRGSAVTIAAGDSFTVDVGANLVFDLD